MIETIWFIAFVLLVMGYAILDGFDLGVGMIHLLPKKDEERRLLLNSIGPVWDGNEVWLVTAGGALFAGFPAVYATLASAFYIPVMLLLTGLIFRACAIEFRSKHHSPVWRWTFDVLFSLASLVITFGLGLVMGNLIRGIDLDSHGEFIGTFFDLLNPYALLIGVFAVFIFIMHGTLFALMKTEGALHDRIRSWVNPSIILFIMGYAIATVATLIYQPHMAESVRERPYFFAVAFLNMLAVANIPREVFHGRDFRAFLSSSINIILLLVLYGIGTFPNLVRARNGADTLSLTVYNSASSEKTLEILIFIALLGVPLVVGYTFAIYRIFRGKTRLDTSSY